jgi:hypothetical protein
MSSWVEVALMLGYFASAAVSGLGWEKGPAFRLMPILYGCLVGAAVFYTYWLADWGRGVGAFIGCVSVGALLSFCVWLEARLVRRPSR